MMGVSTKQAWESWSVRKNHQTSETCLFASNFSFFDTEASGVMEKLYGGKETQVAKKSRWKAKTLKQVWCSSHLSYG